jgi:xanthine dehydrogenase accessory factor
LQWALTTNAGYVGMIGSRIKSNMVFDMLKKEGVTQERIDSVYTPIGIAIKAETPQEIAISIVAELIRVRAEKEKAK